MWRKNLEKSQLHALTIYDIHLIEFNKHKTWNIRLDNDVSISKSVLYE